MKILVLANFGMGVYKFRKELMENLIERGHKVYISLPFDEYVPRLKELGCKCINTKVDRRGTNPFLDLNLLIFYSKLLRKIRPDIVLTYTIKPNVYGGIACRMTRTPYIANVTGLGTAIENKGRLKELIMVLYKLALKNATCIFFQNRSNRKLFLQKGIVKNKTKVIPGSGVNLDLHKYEDYPREEEGIHLLYIGRIMKSKGIEELLHAAQRIKQTFPKVHFDLVGFCEEGYAKELQRYGQQDEVHSFIKNSHAIILPSYHEGLSNVLLEAASTGRPILASRVPGCMETFEEGITGLGFEPRNVESLVETIQQFIQLPYEMKKEMGIAGRKKMEREYDRNIVISAYIRQIIR